MRKKGSTPEEIDDRLHAMFETFGGKPPIMYFALKKGGHESDELSTADKEVLLKALFEAEDGARIYELDSVVVTTMFEEFENSSRHDYGLGRYLGRGQSLLKVRGAIKPGLILKLPDSGIWTLVATADAAGRMVTVFAPEIPDVDVNGRGL